MATLKANNIFMDSVGNTRMYTANIRTTYSLVSDNVSNAFVATGNDNDFKYDLELSPRQLVYRASPLPGKTYSSITDYNTDPETVFALDQGDNDHNTTVNHFIKFTANNSANINYTFAEMQSRSLRTANDEKSLLVFKTFNKMAGNLNTNYLFFGHGLPWGASFPANTGLYVEQAGAAKVNFGLGLPQAPWSNVYVANTGTISFGMPATAVVGSKTVHISHNVTAGKIDIIGGVNFDRQPTLNGTPIGAGYGLANIRYFTGTTANTVYTPPANCRAILVEIVSGGGGGGSANGIGTGTVAGARGGGGGSYVAKFIANTNQTFKYTIGAGGAGGPTSGASENAGAAGGDTYFYGGSLGTTIIIAVAGASGGNYMKPTTSDFYGVRSGGGPGASLGYDGDIFIFGGIGGGGMRGDIFGYGVGGDGGQSFFSLYGGTGGATQSGVDPGGIGYRGSGGGGAAVADSTGNAAGGAGGDGLIRITEYS